MNKQEKELVVNKKYKQKDLERWLVKWKNILRLNHWDIIVRFATAADGLRDDEAALNNYLAETYQSIILIMNEEDYNSGGRFSVYDPEFLLLHELIHLSVESISKKPDHVGLEQAVNTLAASLLRLDRRK